MELKELRISDFKGIKSESYMFGDITRISAINSGGKTTIATAWYWLMADKDYALKDNPNIRPIGTGECIPRVEAVVEINGKLITIAKQQSLAKAKPDARGVSKTTLSNSYEINNVPKTERDFKGYLEGLGVSFNRFLPLSHPNVFTGQKATDMRKILFQMASEKSDYDIAMLDGDTKDVAGLLQSYKYEEIEAMNKASKKKAEVEVKAIPNQIVGLEKAKVNYDIAELELQANYFREQISGLEIQEADIDKASEPTKALRDKIIKAKLDADVIVQEANRAAKKAWMDARAECDQLSDAAQDIFQRKTGLEKELARKKAGLDSLEKQRCELGEAYNKTYAEQMDENTALCPTCGQVLPEEDIARHRLGFEAQKMKRLEDIVAKGSSAKEEIQGLKEEIEKMELNLGWLKKQWGEAVARKTKAYTKLNSLPGEADLSQNKELQDAEKLVLELETELSEIKIGKLGEEQIKLKKSKAQEELLEAEKKIAKASNNVDIDRQIAALQGRQRDFEQAKADAEKILYQLSLVSKKKNELLVEEIDSHFDVVKWVLFDYQKNGEYKECCIPMIDGRRFGDSTNTGREIIAKLDICNSLQKFFGMSLPVFLDGAESLNMFNLPKIDCQLVTLSVTDDTELRIEVA